MEVIAILFPIAILTGAGFLIAYFWAVKSGQYDDTTTPPYRILLDEEDQKKDQS